jgi:Carbohydrate family 9 binding domain-like
MRALMAVLLLAAIPARAQDLVGPYQVLRAPLHVEASILAKNDAFWRPARRLAWGPERYQTAFRALWSDDGLFIRFDVTDSDPWYTLRQRDSRLWEEEVVELFVAPERAGRRYLEIEVSPGNVVSDLYVSLAEQRFDLAWNVQGLQSRVYPRQDSKGRPEGWTVIAFVPWDGVRLPSTVPVSAQPPRPGDRWRFNVFRIERPGGKARPEADALYLAWSPTGQRSFHVAEAFRDLEFQ